MLQIDMIPDLQEKTELAQEVKELKARCERLDTLQCKLSDRRSELELTNKKVTTQLATVEATLMQEKELHEKKDEQQVRQDEQLRLLVESSTAQQSAAKEERSAWLVQLDKAEAVAQDARQALVQKQDRCQELEHALAEVKGELAMSKQHKDDSNKQVEQLLSDLKIAQVTLNACENDLERSKMLLMEKESTMFVCGGQRAKQQVRQALTVELTAAYRPACSDIYHTLLHLHRINCKKYTVHVHASCHMKVQRAVKSFTCYW